MPRRILPAFVVSAIALQLCPLARAATAEPAARGMTEQMLRITDFLDTMLPGVLQEHNMTLQFTPKFSDLRDHEFIRYPLELRYGASDQLELAGGITPFSPNPLNGGREHRWGPGELKLRARYNLRHNLPFFDETTIGFETRAPVGRPPTEINDHYTHVKPFVSAARTLRSWPALTFYSNLSYDRSVELTPRDAPPPWIMRRNVIELSPGLLLKRGELGYFAEYDWRHITEETEWHLGHEVKAGTIWDVPLARSARWGLPGKWQIECAYKFTKEEGRGDNHGIVARVAWRTTLREVLTRTNQPRPSR